MKKRPISFFLSKALVLILFPGALFSSYLHQELYFLIQRQLETKKGIDPKPYLTEQNMF